jgi:peptidoglycan/xylan/chitin deacetylase (PgdA/CDA1 family)
MKYLLSLFLVVAVAVGMTRGHVQEDGTRLTAKAPQKLADWTSQAIAHGAIGTKKIALTFDDGPNPDTTPDILAVLARYHAKGTFFLIGRRVKKYPELVQRIYSEGHQIGNHSFTHPNLTKLGRDAAFAELSDCSAAIKAVTGHAPELCRPPGGNADRTIVNLAGALGMRSVAWSINTADFETLDADTVQDRVVKIAQSGDIVLLHDKVYATIICLDDMLHSLQLQGYRFVTVSELMSDATDEDNLRFVPKTWFK